MKDILKLIRPYQWVKNVFVMLPLFFGGSLLNMIAVWQAIFACIAFCFTASAVYCLNDIVDVEADRRHKEKCHRPIASGAISMVQGYIVMAICLLLALGACLIIPENPLFSAAILAGYFLMEVFYCLWLKRYAIVDVSILSLGFVLRIVVGGVATSIMPSHWLVMMTFLVCLLMALGKRRDDVIKYKETGIAPRHNTKRYSLTFINQAITVCASTTLVCYILYTVSPEVTSRANFKYAYLTSIFVIMGLLRYMQLATVDGRSGDPTKLMLHDRFIQVTLVVWLVVFGVMIYA